MSDRNSDALAIQAGACNPVAIAGTLHAHCLAMLKAGHDTQTIRRDPALRLICHQLAFLFGTWAVDNDLDTYGKLTDACKTPAG